LYSLKQGYLELFGSKNSDIATARARRHYIPGQIWHPTALLYLDKKAKGAAFAFGSRRCAQEAKLRTAGITHQATPSATTRQADAISERFC
jgi:hypothetical protein